MNLPSERPLGYWGSMTNRKHTKAHYYKDSFRSLCNSVKNYDHAPILSGPLVDDLEKCCKCQRFLNRSRLTHQLTKKIEHISVPFTL